MVVLRRVGEFRNTLNDSKLHTRPTMTRVKMLKKLMRMATWVQGGGLCRGHMSRSYVEVICRGHMSRPYVEVICRGHMSRLNINVICRGHMSRSYVEVIYIHKVTFKSVVYCHG